MKYKLIKKYPSLHKTWEEGMIVAIGDNKFLYSPCNSKYYNGFLNTKSEVENYPEFWEEIVEKDYEILSFSLDGSKDIIRYKNKYNMFPFDNGSDKKCNRNNEFSEQSLLDNSRYFIHSVKRLSDGEIFTLGDRTGLTNGNGYRCLILSFELSYNTYGSKKYRNKETLKVTLGTGYKDKDEWGPFELDKIRPTISFLFTTEDGIDIFEGDDCVIVRNDFSYYEIVNIKSIFFLTLNRKGFSTVKAAEEYIDLNKPVFSKNDVEEILGRFINDGLSLNAIMELQKKK